MAAAYLLTLMAVPVRAFGWVLGELPRALVGHERIARVLDAPGEPPTARGPCPRAPAAWTSGYAGPAWSSQDPTGPRTLLHDVDLDLPAGAVVALVGPTGSGKTTLAGLLCRLHEPGRRRR